VNRHEIPKLKTRIGTLTADTITVCGHNLVDDLLGRIDIGQLFYLEVTGRLPDPAQSRMINALMVAIAEHGMMPSVIAARLTYMGAPESLQGAVASGLLGAGDVFVGPAGNVARMLQVEAAGLPGDDSERANRIVETYFESKRRLPGLGHPHHEIDPRSVRLLALQQELGVGTRFTSLMLEIQRVACERAGRHLTFNAVAAVGAIASDLDIDWRAVRGIGLVARTVGLVGHVLEEMKRPTAGAIWDLVHDHTEYSDPGSDY
jgi:citrate synthase